MLEQFLIGINLMLTVENVMFAFLGVAVGIFVGAIPGLTVTMATALMVPLTFAMEPVPAIAMLLGVYKGGMFGGSISAILINTPGTPAASATALDGFPLAKKGQAVKAMKMGLYASVMADTSTDLILILVAPPLARVALKFGPPELFSLVLFSLTIIAAVSGRSLLKGLAAGTLGLLFTTVGMDPVTGLSRYDFGYVAVMKGVGLIPMLIGIFAISEILVRVENALKEKVDTLALRYSSRPEDNTITWREMRGSLRTIVRGIWLGTFLGAIPGLGSTITAFLNYGMAKRASKHPDSFGQGELEGVAAAESGNSAVCGATLIPLLSLGIPGDIVTAVLLGAFMIQGIAPGPTMFMQHANVIYALFVGLMVCNLANLIIGRLGLGSGEIRVQGARRSPLPRHPRHLFRGHLLGGKQPLRRGSHVLLRYSRLRDEEVRLPARTAAHRIRARPHARKLPEAGDHHGGRKRLHLLHPPGVPPLRGTHRRVGGGDRPKRLQEATSRRNLPGRRAIGRGSPQPPPHRRSRSFTRDLRPARPPPVLSSTRPSRTRRRRDSSFAFPLRLRYTPPPSPGTGTGTSHALEPIRDDSDTMKNPLQAAPSSDERTKPSGMVYVKLLLTAVFWGGTFIAARVLARDVPPFSAAFLRFAIACLFLIPLTLKHEGRLPPLKRAQVLPVVLLGMTGVFAYNAFFFTGLKLVPAGRSALIIANNPVFISLFSALIFKERLTPVKMFGIMISVAGAIIVVSRGDVHMLVQGGIGRGDLLIFGCVASWVTYSLIAKAAMKDLSPLVSVCYSTVAGTALLSVPAVAEGLPGRISALGLAQWGGVAYLAVFGTVLSFIWYFQGIQRIGPMKASLFINFVPVSAVTMAYFILGEPLTVSLLVGAVFVVCGVFLTTTGFNVKSG